MTAFWISAGVLIFFVVIVAIMVSKDEVDVDRMDDDYWKGM